MKNSENIKRLNKILDNIEYSTDKISELESLLYKFKKGRFGHRYNCGSVLCFEIEGYLSQKHKINMSDDIAKAISNMLTIAISEEKEYLNELEIEYNNILLKIKNEQ